MYTHIREERVPFLAHCLAYVVFWDSTSALRGDIYSTIFNVIH